MFLGKVEQLCSLNGVHTFFSFQGRGKLKMSVLSLQISLCEMIRQERKTRRMTQRDIAKLAGLSMPTVRLLERGRGTIQSLQQVLRALDVELVGRNLPQGEEIGRQVALLRKRRGLGQRQLATLILKCCTKTQAKLWSR
jgi:transcriptional regulator with XRE-family HTH domain